LTHRSFSSFKEVVIMARVMFVDDMESQILRQWRESGCDANHELLPFERFVSVDRTRMLVAMFKPDVIIVGHALGVRNVTGPKVVRALKDRGYLGKVFANGTGGAEQFTIQGIQIDASTDRDPLALKRALAGVNGRRVLVG